MRRKLDAYVAHPAGTPLASLVVIQEIFGVNDHIRPRHRRLGSRWLPRHRTGAL